MSKFDFRSDTVTVPCRSMREVMMEADVGDDVYGEDPTVNRLQQMAAKLLNKEDALFAPSGTQTNLLALMAHCERGDEYIVGQDAHTYKYEGGGAAVLGSIQPQPIDFEKDGTLAIENIRSVIKAKDHHFAKSRLVCLENTVSGRYLPLDYPQQVRQLCEQHQLSLHLDGARLFNAVVAQKVSAQSLAEEFDSASICLSKGLGAPVGSLLVGSSTLIEKAKRWRKVLGGGMRQAGILAAAGIYALENNVERLADDHQRAKYLTEELKSISILNIGPHSGMTNMVFVGVPDESVPLLHKKADEMGVVLPSGNSMRLVTHLNINDEGIDKCLNVFRSVFSGG